MGKNVLTDEDIDSYQRVGESQTENLGLAFFVELCDQAREANVLREKLANMLSEFQLQLLAVSARVALRESAACTLVRERHPRHQLASYIRKPDDDTSISWTDKTWNCVRGCSRVRARRLPRHDHLRAREGGGVSDWRNATCADCGAKCFEGQTHVEHNAGWLKRLLMWDYTDLALNGYPGWEVKDQGGGWGKAPSTVHLAIKNKVDKSSDDIAREWDDVSDGRFYNRDQSRDGYVFVGEGEYYDAYFYFQKLSDAVAFAKRYGGSIS